MRPWRIGSRPPRGPLPTPGASATASWADDTKLILETRDHVRRAALRAPRHGLVRHGHASRSVLPPLVKLAPRHVRGIRPAPRAFHAGNVLTHAAAALVRGSSSARCCPRPRPSRALRLRGASVDGPGGGHRDGALRPVAGLFVLAACALVAVLPEPAALSRGRLALVAGAAVLAFASKESAFLLPLPLAAIAVVRGARVRGVAAPRPRPRGRGALRPPARPGPPRHAAPELARGARRGRSARAILAAIAAYGERP